ncbi:MAG TPA: flagellar basal body rod protein FlgB [Bradyrhizobium sp.]|nr:flagellar basal body rod protein FlgB [Bradyrhizobium sp.]
MDFTHQPLFAMISKRLSWLSERQRVLAQNISNVDTPAYKPRDLKAVSFEQMVKGASATMPMALTSTQHISTQNPASGIGANDIAKEKPVETTLSGNAVTLDVELMKLGQNAQDHALALNLYHDQIAMFRTVIGGQG